MNAPTTCPACGKDVSIADLIKGGIYETLRIGGPVLPFTCECGRGYRIALMPRGGLGIRWDEEKTAE